LRQASPQVEPAEIQSDLFFPAAPEKSKPAEQLAGFFRSGGNDYRTYLQKITRNFGSPCVFREYTKSLADSTRSSTRDSLDHFFDQARVAINE
jgi:hypothetical protein